MKQNPLILPLIGSGIAFLCFFFSWLKFDFSSLGLDPMFSNLQGTATVSGIQFVIGGSIFDSLTFLSTLVILGICFYMLTQKTPWKSRIPVLICSAFGLLYVLIGLILFIIQDNFTSSKLLEYVPTEIELGNIVSFQFGLYGVALGFIFALFGAWKIPKSGTAIDDDE